MPGTPGDMQGARIRGGMPADTPDVLAAPSSIGGVPSGRALAEPPQATEANPPSARGQEGGLASLFQNSPIGTVVTPPSKGTPH